jgi:tetratricopeptide (TPR) repeat protein
MPEYSRGRRAVAALALGLAGALAGAAETPGAGIPAEAAPVQRSALDAPLFYQLLVGEMALRNGEAGNAYQLFIDAARRTKDPQLFRRAMDVALQSRAGQEALAATRAWREVLPDSTEPLRLELQILTALNQLQDGGPPLAALLRLTPAAERGGLVAALPRFFERAADKKRTAELLDATLPALTRDESTRAPARVARGRAWLAAGDPDRALALASEGAAEDPDAPGPVLLAMELRTQRPESEAVVTAYLARADAVPALRLAWARVLTAAQRYPEAIMQLETATTQVPGEAPAWLMLGALHLELKHHALAEAALQRYVALAQGAAPAPAPAAASAATADEALPGDPPVDQGLVQAWLMLAQSAEQRGDFKAAETWLARIDDPQRALEVQARRANLMARQGQVDTAVASLRQVPERSEADARAKLLAEAQLLREVKRWQSAYDAFERAHQRFADDVDLLYEQAMVAEKLDRLDDMERLLRRVIAIKPDHGHAHNALGYSLADRRVRLPEARDLIRQALDLMPGDPFITDSLGWVEYRLGNLDEAERLLRQAWAKRPDTEIGAHLGEVLWARGQQDEARRIWRQAQARDGANEVLRETLARLQVGL